MSRRDDMMTSFWAGVLVLVFFILIAIIYDAVRPKCEAPKCDDTPEEGNIYCYYHRYYKLDKIRSELKKYKKQDETTYKSTYSGSNNYKYSYDPYDVDDYDDPDDFADEWAEEFGDGSFDDGYDDAYDYWEDNH